MKVKFYMPVDEDLLKSVKIAGVMKGATPGEIFEEAARKYIDEWAQELLDEHSKTLEAAIKGGVE